MYPLFESICVENGQVKNESGHQMRFEKAYHQIFGKNPSYSLLENLAIPVERQKGLVKMKVSYNALEREITFENYVVRSIKSLQIVEDNTIDYSLKYTNRNSLNNLLKQKGNCDDILIVKNGFLTDSSYCNIIFYDEHRWWTPDTPLLAGTARQRLLDAGKITACPLKPGDIKNFSGFKLINAMRDFEKIMISTINQITI